MRLLIAAVGKLRAGPEATLLNDYLNRADIAGRKLGLKGPAICECDAPKNLTGGKRQIREGEMLLKAASDPAQLVLLDERGDDISSKEWAKMIAGYRDQGASMTAFLIGGADGHGPEVRKKAAKIVSFGAATWPHMLVRVMLAEQLYRTVTILSGHPYHRA